MRKYVHRLFVVSTYFLFFSVIAHAQVTGNATNPQSQNAASQRSFFTGGTASVERYPTPPDFNCGVAKVSFQPAARTIWHAHAGGQVIIVVSGTAWYQEKGKPKQVVKQGETIICPPNVMHWHGASPDGEMAHTVATPNLDKGGVTAGEPVTDQEYGN